MINVESGVVCDIAGYSDKDRGRYPPSTQLMNPFDGTYTGYKASYRIIKKNSESE